MRRFHDVATRGVRVPAVFALGLLLLASCSRAARETEVEPTAVETTPSATVSGEPKPEPAPAEGEPILAQGEQLYGNHCAGCHGLAGDGKGDAAKWLYPRPRNFQSGEFRLVTTGNHVPSDADLRAVLDRGMPGSAMPSFAHLPESEKEALVRYVRHLTAHGIEQQLVAEAKAFGDEPDMAEIAGIVAEQTRPGEPIAIPQFDTLGADAVARGAQVYAEACSSCHGKTGKGDGAERQFNTDGTPTRPRDFTKGIFKGRPEPAAIYARVRAGMPGSPMPAEQNLTDAQISDLVAFVLSLSDEETRRKAVLERHTIVAHATEETLTDDPESPLWNRAEAVRLTVTPLWWRDYEDLSVYVQALDDGKSLAVRLRWQDSSQNVQAVRPQEFEDMAALQLSRARPEPFLGMGAQGKGTVDVWLWQPSRQTPLAQRADVDTTYPNMSVDLYPFEQTGDGARPHATENQDRTYITAWAAGNLRSDPQQAPGGASLEAAGFGSLTMRPPISQLTSAGASWSDGHWTVVLRRPLEVDPESGITLAPGDRLSIAFAIWDGAQRDRNGQKRVTIWQDLELE